MPVTAVSWIDAGKIDYALGGRFAVLCLGREPHQFALLRDARQYIGTDALIVANAHRRDWWQRAAPYFDRIEPLPDVPLVRAGEPVLMLKVARGIDFRGTAARQSAMLAGHAGVQLSHGDYRGSHLPGSR
jgi:hypothetical protein